MEFLLYTTSVIFKLVIVLMSAYFQRVCVVNPAKLTYQAAVMDKGSIVLYLLLIWYKGVCCLRLVSDPRAAEQRHQQREELEHWLQITRLELKTVKLCTRRLSGQSCSQREGFIASKARRMILGTTQH